MSEKTKENDLQEIGRRAFESLAEMVAALECDYERLEELREERNQWDSDRSTPGATWADSRPEDAEELAELEKAAGECESREDAEQRIQEDPLSIRVRSGWVNLGEEMVAGEFEILLSTGGPAVRIVGELDDGEPYRAWIESQDWFKPWTQFFGGDEETLLTYCRCFYFGE